MDKPNAAVGDHDGWQMWIKSRRNFHNNNVDVSGEGMLRSRCSGTRARIVDLPVVEINYASAIKIHMVCVLPKQNAIIL